MRGTLYVGTSGFAFDAWKGPFYPEKIKAKEMLGFYATRFRSVEINYTFRRYPSESAIEGWKAQTPEGFLFTLKANQRITHVLKLVDAGDAAAAFIERAAPLGERLGPILFQCPPYLRYERERLETFLDALPKGLRYVFEFRHASWAEAKELIASRGATWCVAETDDEAFEGALDPKPFVYMRLRKTSYASADLEVWAKRIAPVLDAGSDVFCYLKHEDEGLGPRYATELSALVDAQKPAV